MNFGLPSTAVAASPSQYAMAMAQGGASLQPRQDLVRVYEKGLWSTQRYANAASPSEARLFTTPKGQVGQGFGTSLGIAETNMRESNRVQQNEAMDVFGLSAYVYYIDSDGVVYLDMANVLNNSVLVWDFSTSRLEIAPFYLVGAGGGIFGTTADTGASDGGNSSGSRVALNNGGPATIWTYQEQPIFLHAGTTFNVVQEWGPNVIAIDGGSGNSDLGVRITLLGRIQSAIAAG